MLDFIAGFASVIALFVGWSFAVASGIRIARLKPDEGKWHAAVSAFFLTLAFVILSAT